jgi:hypothetical protein
MRKRLRIVVAFAFGITAILWTAPDLGTRDENPHGLSDEEDAELRAVVSTHQISSTRHWWPKGADENDLFQSWRVMLPPARIAQLYKVRPVGTLRCLKAIAERGSPADAYMAVAYAYAAVGFATHDSSLVHRALIRAETFMYGSRRDLEKHRRRGVEEMDRLIEDVETQQTGDKWP